MGQIGRNLAHALAAPAALRALARAHPGTPLNLRAVRRVAYFPRLGIAFNRIKKNANTSVMLLLAGLEAEAAGRGPIPEARPGAVFDASVACLFDLGRADLARLGGFHRVVVVRDPYSRVLSAFLDKFRQPEYRRRHGAFPLTPEGFGAFLDWLERGGLGRDLHWNLQTRLMLMPVAAHDSVIRFEALRAGMIAMLEGRGLEGRGLEGRGIRVPADALAELPAVDRAKKTAAGERMAAFYTPGRAAQVARLHASDFAALGYDPAFPASAA